MGLVLQRYLCRRGVVAATLGDRSALYMHTRSKACDGAETVDWSVGRMRDMQRWRAAVEARNVIAPGAGEEWLLQHTGRA